MYPEPAVLEEVGRVTISGSRLDLQLAYLCLHLDHPHGVPFDKLRRMGGGDLTKLARHLARLHLEGSMQSRVLAALDDAAKARDNRHDVVHQEWVLRWPDGFDGPALEEGMSDEQVEAIYEQWRRAGRPSPGWLRLPARSTDLAPAQTLEELRNLELRLSALGARVLGLTFEVASSRETGKPEGYVRGTRGHDVGSALP